MFNLESYFNGKLKGHGMFQKRSGEVLRRFIVDITATGRSHGLAFHWIYTLHLAIGNDFHDMTMDDWMYQIDEKTVLNRTKMRKFGIQFGQVTLSFTKLT